MPLGGVVARDCKLSWWVADLDPRSVRVLRKFDVSDMQPPTAVPNALKGKGGTGKAEVDGVPSMTDGGEVLALWADGYGVLDVMMVASQSNLKTDDVEGSGKRVMLWTTNQQVFTNATARLAWLEQLSTVKDVVDVVSPGSYYASQTWPHGLMRFPGATAVHAALREAGFKVQPLVGGIGGSFQNDVFGSPSFIAEAAAEIKDGGLEGLNFDWEPSTCAAESDSQQYADFIEKVGRSSGGFVTATFPCMNDACDPAVLAKSAARVISMDTYVSAAGFFASSFVPT